jgi:hypothetical protein
VDTDIRLTFQDPNDADGDGVTSYDMRAMSSFTFSQVPTIGQATYTQFSITASNTQLLPKPVITNLTSGQVTASGFNVSFTTDIPTGAVLSYGTSATDLSQKMTATDETTAHSFDVTGLTPNTAYYYQVSTSKTGYDVATSDVQSLQTLQKLNLVGQIQVQPSATSATLNFQTSAPATAVVNYGTAQDVLDQQVTVTQSQANQSIVIPNLTPGKQYFARITSSAEGYEPLVSDTLSFSTLGTFTLSDPVISNVTATGATVTVNTGLPSNVTIKYGTTALDQTQSSENPAATHTFTLTGLTPGTQYQLQATASAAGFEDQVSQTVNLTTLKTFQISTPPSVSGITASGATIGLGASVPVTATVQYGTDNQFQFTNSVTTATENPSFTLTDLLSNTAYQYRVVLQAPGYESITTAPLTFTTTQAVTLGSGDVDGDGKVTVADATMAAKAAIGLVQLTPQQASAADTRLPAGTVDIADVVWILKIAVGLVPPPPG